MLWQKLFDWVKYLFDHKEQTEQNTAVIEEHDHAMRDMAVAFEQMKHELSRQRENEVHEREKLALRMENALLRERRLLPAASSADANSEATLRVIEELKREIEELRQRLEERDQE